MVSIDLRKTILEMHSQGYKVTLISRILGMPTSTVWNIIRKFQTTKEVADLPRTGRPRCTRTPKKIKAIRERVRRNPKRAMRKITLEVGITNSSMHRLIHEDLKMKSLLLQKHQFLSNLHKKKRLERCKILHDEIEPGKSGEIVWSDEKLFTIEQSNLLCAICDDVPRRLKDVISNNGGHIV